MSRSTRINCSSCGRPRSGHVAFYKALARPALSVISFDCLPSRKLVSAARFTLYTLLASQPALNHVRGVSLLARHGSLLIRRQAKEEDQ